jgi:hypothetical protein
MHFRVPNSELAPYAENVGCCQKRTLRGVQRTLKRGRKKVRPVSAGRAGPQHQLVTRSAQATDFPRPSGGRHSLRSLGQTRIISEALRNAKQKPWSRRPGLGLNRGPSGPTARATLIVPPRQQSAQQSRPFKLRARSVSERCVAADLAVSIVRPADFEDFGYNGNVTAKHALWPSRRRLMWRSPPICLTSQRTSFIPSPLLLSASNPAGSPGPSSSTESE